MLLNDAEVMERIGEAGVMACFSMEPHTRHVDAVFQRVFGAEG